MLSTKNPKLKKLCSFSIQNLKKNRNYGICFLNLGTSYLSYNDRADGQWTEEVSSSNPARALWLPQSNCRIAYNHTRQ